MIKIIISFFLVLSSFLAFSQNQYEQEMQQEVALTQWTQVGQPQNCNPSFYWLITQSTYQDQYGRVLYKIYFYSNSRYCNGEWAQTYVQGISVIVNNQLMNQVPGWVIFREVYQPRWMSVWAPPGSRVEFRWTNVTVN